MTASGVERTLGVLLAKVEGIERAMETSEEKSDVSRANVHRRLDEVVSRTGSLESDMAKVKGDMTDVKEVTDQVVQWKLMGMGALGVTGLAAGAVGAILAAYWNKIVAAVTG